VNAGPLNRSPRTATDCDVPGGTVNVAEPRLPATPANPGRLRSAAAVLPYGGSVTDEDPMSVPELSQAVIVELAGNRRSGGGGAAFAHWNFYRHAHSHRQ
jgi:hypothetical protein